MSIHKTYEELLAENEAMRWQLEEATDTLHAIRTGQIDALVIHGEDGAALYSLKTADQTYRVFIEKMNEGAVTLNAEGIILYCNSMFAQLAELPLSQVLGQRFDNLVPDNCRSDFQLLFQQGWAKDIKIELPIQNASRTVPCQLSITALELDDGLALSVIVTDLSYQKENQDLLRNNNQRLEGLNAALERSNHDLLQFASVASHDLQEPLRKIMVFADMLSARINEAESAALLERITLSSLRMKAMIADILAYSRLGQTEIISEAVPLGEIVAEILDDFEILIAEKGATVKVDPLPAVFCNRGQMRQAFQNLISNALKFSREHVAPFVHIAYERKPGSGVFAITITDNGIGFSEEYKEKIFSLFHRLNTKDQFEGSGIGLAVTRKIIANQQGKISASSEEGKGSVFRIELPIRKLSQAQDA